MQVLFNFRADRMVEISKAFEYEDFNSFDRKRWPKARSCAAPHAPALPAAFNGHAFRWILAGSRCGTLLTKPKGAADSKRPGTWRKEASICSGIGPVVC